MLLLKGEWWENILDGTPLFQEVAGQFHPSGDNPAQIDLIFSERIIGTRGVREITEFESSLNPQTRTYSAAITVMTVYDVPFELNVIGSGGVISVSMSAPP